MKHEWRKSEKHLYLPRTKPEFIEVPAFNFFTIKGAGNPNDDHFPDYIQVLYALSYAVKMSPKKGIKPVGYFEYTVYPLEGIWDLAEEAKEKFTDTIDKNDLVFNLMIRQPIFVNQVFANQVIEKVKAKKPHPFLDQIQFETIEDGKCIQMMHLGSYDDEPTSFKQMEAFALEQGFKRKTKKHREIYLSDARKVAPVKLKTVLRFQVIKI